MATKAQRKAAAAAKAAAVARRSIGVHATMPGDPVDAGPPERARHGVTEPRDVFNRQGRKIGEGLRVRMSVDGVDGITAPMRAAAVAFRNLYEAVVGGISDQDSGTLYGQQRIRSNMPPTTWADWRLDAVKAYGAIREELGPLVGPVVEKVVGEDMSMAAAAAALRRNRQEALGQLKVGLDQLARRMKIKDAA